MNRCVAAGFPGTSVPSCWGRPREGIIFGWLGDRTGRAKAMGLSVLTYSLLAGSCYFVTSPWQMLVLWFLACTGVGGVWPNGVSLSAEACPACRPLACRPVRLHGQLGADAAGHARLVGTDHARSLALGHAGRRRAGFARAFYRPLRTGIAELAGQPAGSEAQDGVRARLWWKCFARRCLSTPSWEFCWVRFPKWATGDHELAGAVGHQVQEHVGEHGLSAWTQWTKSSGRTGRESRGWQIGDPLWPPQRLFPD